MLSLRYDPTRLRWHERLVRFDTRQQAWVPWHWRHETAGRWTSWLWWGR